jgi:AraC-like DNA-binding protein
MTLAPTFFRDPETYRILEMAALSAALPLCIHSGGGLKIEGWGGCAACHWVNATAAGRNACQKSREDAALLSGLRQNTVNFVCHMGLNCVIAVPFKDEPYTLVFGPFIPEGMTQGIHYAIRQGFIALTGKEHKEKDFLLPFKTDDIRRLPMASVSASMDWLLWGLKARLERWEETDTDDLELETSLEETPSTTSIKLEHTQNTAIHYKIVGLALLCGQSREVQHFLEDRIDEIGSAPLAIHAQLAHCLVILLEITQNFGAVTDAAWVEYKHFIEEASKDKDRKALLKGAEKVARLIARNSKTIFQEKYSYLPAAMNSICQDYAANNLLSKVAAETDVAPSTITRMLQKLTGASFSEVLGQIRTTRASLLLRNTQISASAIAVLVGIADQSNFIKIFKRYQGCSPIEYRRRFKKSL